MSAIRLTCHTLPVLALVSSLCVSSAAHASGDQPAILFDLPPVVAAGPTDRADTVVIELKLSSMITSAEAPRIDQWLVRCQPRDSVIKIVDYAPRTEVASELKGPIQVKEIDEKTESLGFSLDGSYGHLARANAGSDRGKKQTDSLQFERIAPLQTVVASGTIDRGRGVYFKLRSAAQQVLEGEKSFRLTLQVPENWRGSLIDVSVIAQAEHRPFPGWESQDKTIGAAQFVIATYREGDSRAARLAHQLAEAEYLLRSTLGQQSDPSGFSLPSVLRRFTTKLESASHQVKSNWMQRLIKGDADPHLDAEIRKLPMPMRIAVLDYCDAREDFSALSGITGGDNARHVVAKPPHQH